MITFYLNIFIVCGFYTLHSALNNEEINIISEHKKVYLLHVLIFFYYLKQ